jgi:hypothetical protein
VGIRAALPSSDTLIARDFELLFKIYAAALHVEETLPDSDLACIAAKKIIASFHSHIGSPQTFSLARH